MFCGTPVVAQEDDKPATQFWADFNPTRELSEKTDVYGDIGFRHDGSTNEFYRLVVRPGVRYRIGENTRVMGGIGSFFTWNTVAENRWEIRPWVGFRYFVDRKILPFDHYARVEWRVEYNTNTWEVVKSLRMRYRFRVHVDLSAFKPGRYWRALGGIELFGTLAGQQGQFQEKFRLGAGLERSFSTGLRLRLDVTWQKSGRLFNPTSTDALYLRIRFFKSV